MPTPEEHSVIFFPLGFCYVAELLRYKLHEFMHWIKFLGYIRISSFIPQNEKEKEEAGMQGHREIAQIKV